MAVDEKWYFTKEQLLQSPSRKSGYDVDKELSCRQQAANFIQDMGQRLQVSQLCINTAIVYMHRFYVFHSLAAFHRNAIAAAALFLAAKVEEQPRKLEHVIKVAHMCLHRENPNLDTKTELYLEQAQDLVFNENVLLQTLGFDVAIDHPHTHVVRCCQLVRASKDLAQTSYFMASNSLHLTTMCLQYKPTVVACFCIHLACKWSNWEIPRSNEGKDWFWYIDKTVTIDLLEQLTAEFLAILDKCPTKLKRKMMSMNQNNTPGFTQQTVSHDGLQFEEPRKLTGEGMKAPEGLFPVQKSSSQSSSEKAGSSSSSALPSGHSHHQKIDYREYREKKERERLEREKQQQQQQQRDGHSSSSSNHHHHSKPNMMPNKSYGNVQSRSSSGSASHKSYQQTGPHGGQQNIHFQNMKDGSRDGSQGFQSSASAKDSNYLKQHPPHADRDGGKESVTFHGQYSQGSNMQNQGYSHKSDSNYSGNYIHRDGSRGSHGNQGGGGGGGSSSLPQTHHSQSQGVAGNSLNNQKDYLMNSQRDGAGGKELESQSHVKDAMSSSIRDIIGQSVNQKDVHSMTNDRKDHMRDKSRMGYIHGSSTGSNYRPESMKSGRSEKPGLNFQESADRKMDEFASKMKEKSLKKEEEPVIDAVKIDCHPTQIKNEMFDETDVGDESSSTWSLSNSRSEKNNVPVNMKTEPISIKGESGVEKLDPYASNSDPGKSQSLHPGKMYDSKYKTHHYHSSSSSKNSEVPQVKIEKPGAQCSSDIHKKLSDRSHEKHRKVQELERVSHSIDGSGNLGELSKHHKPGKDVSSDKNKLLLSGQQGSDQRLKEKMSPSVFQKSKAMPSRQPPNLGFIKSESGHFSLEGATGPGSNACDRNETASGQGSKSLKPMPGLEESGKNAAAFQKQKSHEFGVAGTNAANAQDSSQGKMNKTSSIFSPDSKIPPQNILSSLEKDSKKGSSSTHRGHTSNKTPPNSTGSSKKAVFVTAVTAVTTSTTSTTGSLFSPPLPKIVPSIPPRHRTPSSGSEPELIPLITKLEDTPGYENIIRERKIALTPTSELLPGAEKKEKLTMSGDKTESGNAFLYGSEHKVGSKDGKSSDVKINSVKSDLMTQPIVSKPGTNVKFTNEIRSDLGAVIYPTNPKSLPASKSSQGFPPTDAKHSALTDSVSTVNLSGIEKMVDTSISPAKQVGQFGAGPAKSTGGGGGHFNLTNSSGNAFGSSSTTTTTTLTSPPDETEKSSVGDQTPSKGNNVMSSQEIIDVDGLGYLEKKRSEKKKKKEKHKHKEKDKDKSERKKEKKKHKDKDKERSKEKDKYKDKEKHRDKERHKEKEIDVVSSEIPIKITIPKDKISGSLKFKISKDCLKKDEPESLKSSGELKIKISKDVISSIGYKEDSKGDSKKRERSPKSSGDLPHAKSLKTSEKKSSSGSSVKSNGTEGPSRNSSSHRYSVSENGSCFDISSLHDFPFDFEDNGHGIIKTPDYDFEALNASESPHDLNTSPDGREIEESDQNSHNELEETRDHYAATNELDTGSAGSDLPGNDDFDGSCGGMTTSTTTTTTTTTTTMTTTDVVRKPDSNETISPEHRGKVDVTNVPSDSAGKVPSPVQERSSNVNDGRDEVLPVANGEEDAAANQMISVENCDVLKNYKTILDSHSKRCDPEMPNQNASPVSSQDNATEPPVVCSNDDNNNRNTDEPALNSDKSVKPTKTVSETENPNYYNKYFKKEGGARMRPRDDKRQGKVRPEDRQRFYDGRRFRPDFADRDRRDDRRFYKDYRDMNKGSTQFYPEDRRFDFPGYRPNQYFNPTKPDPNLGTMNFEVNPTGPPNMYQSCPPPAKTAPPPFPQMCDPSIPPNANVPYQYGYFNNYMYPNGGYRFYGNVPYINMSLIQQQQPMPPGTGEALAETPPLPLEPPPDLPPPPETPPPPPK